MSELTKVTEEHRRRRAVVYVRQSSVGQVERNTESAARQYALRERAVELGWPAGSVAVVDEDTGRSGASSDGRLGFRELVAEVGLGHVGLILALETSRLARCSADWHRLLDLCALTGTLIADADGVYSPADFNDRLLLGLKGTMSEAELHFIRARLVGGLRNKAARGELRLPLPVGLDRDDDDRVVLCPDEQVRHAIDRVFALWRALGSARQVALELIAEGQQLPRRTIGQRRIRWARASYGAVHDILTNPAYAGAFVFGRQRSVKRLDEHGEVRVGRVDVPIEEWSVCLPDHHPGYVSWDRVPRHPRAAASERETARRGRRRRARGRRAAAGARPLRALRTQDAGRVLGHERQGRPVRVHPRPRLSRDRPGVPVARRRAAGQGGRRGVPGRGRAGRDRGDRRRDRRARGPARAAPRRAAARGRARAIRGRPRTAEVRRVRAGEPARRTHPRTRAGAGALRTRARARQSSPSSSAPARSR